MPTKEPHAGKTRFDTKHSRVNTNRAYFRYSPYPNQNNHFVLPGRPEAVPYRMAIDFLPIIGRMPMEEPSVSIFPSI